MKLVRMLRKYDGVSIQLDKYNECDVESFLIVWNNRISCDVVNRKGERFNINLKDVRGYWEEGNRLFIELERENLYKVYM